jgi:uncharacterized protein YjbI with pentapeptide repeats
MPQATFVSTDTVSFPADLTYQDFLKYLFESDCTTGSFLVTTDNTVLPVETGFKQDLARSFFLRGVWRNSTHYVCTANLSKSIWRGRGKDQPIVFLAGVDLSQADVRFTDLSRVIFEDELQSGGVEFDLAANLEGVIYNDFTTWPVNFLPPDSAVEVPISP